MKERETGQSEANQLQWIDPGRLIKKGNPSSLSLHATDQHAGGFFALQLFRFCGFSP
jgi:hypothetical protein